MPEPTPKPAEAPKEREARREKRAAERRRRRRGRPFRAVRTARQLLAIEGLFSHVGRLLRELIGSLGWRRGRLAVRAGTGDPAAVDGLASGLEDDDLSVRRTALQALGNLKRKEALTILEDYRKKEKDKGLVEEAGRVIKAIKGT